jgi:hypothetical protein
MDDLNSHHQDLHPSQQLLQTQHSGSEDKTQMVPEEEANQARQHEDILRPSVPHSPLPPPAKRKVVFAVSYLDCTDIALTKLGSNRLGKRTY